MLNGELVLAAVAIVGILILARMWRNAESRVTRLQSENEALETRGKKLGADLSKQTRTRKRQAEELATLRSKADKVKKRQSKSGDQPLGTTARIRDHEAQVERVELERDRAHAEQEELVRQIAQLETRLVAAGRALEEATAPEPDPLSPANAEETAISQLQAELATNREELTKQREDLGTARQTEARMRKRMSNQDQLYASLRAELDVKKDRLRTQEEQLQRLRALKAAVIG